MHPDEIQDYANILSQGLDLTGSADAPPTAEITVAVVLAHIAHLFSIIVLYYLTKAAFPSSSNKTFPFISAALHIISPAGLFLSAPYGEPLFSCLNFLGYLLYLWSVGAGRDQKPFQRDLNVVLAGFTLGLAATVRSNGLLSGIPFLYDSLLTVHTLSRGIEILHATRKLIVLGVGGSLVGLGFAVPQWLAHVQYCQGRPVSGEGGLRPWCTRTVPSIYAWVQDQYWYVAPEGKCLESGPNVYFEGTLAFCDTGPFLTCPCSCLPLQCSQSCPLLRHGHFAVATHLISCLTRRLNPSTRSQAELESSSWLRPWPMTALSSHDWLRLSCF